MQNWPAIESLRWIGVLSLAAIIVSGMVPVLKTVSSPSQSVSQTWSINTPGHRLISVILTVFGGGLAAFITGWLIPTYDLWAGMYLVTLAGYIAILGVAWFPIAEKPGEHSFTHPHFIGGAVAACGAIVAYASILLADTAPTPLSHNLILIALLYTATWPVFFVRGVRNYFIILEMILVALFTAAIVTLTLG